MKLVKVVPSTNFTKKFDAFFDDGKKVSFGLADSETYLEHHDKVKRDAYRKRHKKDLETQDVRKPGYLSFFISWGDYTSLARNVADYKRRFGL
jgi:hypothetical protein